MGDSMISVVQVTNISHNVTGEQIKHFLEYIGRVKEIKIYPDGEGVDSNQTKVAYARFDNPENVDVALHLTNTVMVDRALIVLPYPDETIPDEMKALRVAAPISTVAGMLPPTIEWPLNVVNMVCGTGSNQTIQTLDAKLVELGLGQYPPLPAKTDPSKIEEIRRTIYVSNLDPSVNAEQLVQFFSQAGEVMFVRMAGDENLPSRNAYIEFTNQRSVPTALAYNGVQFSNRHLKVSHSLTAINGKPQTKGQEQLSKEIDETMKKYKDMEHLIQAAAGSNTRGPSKRARSRSRSKDRRRHKSRERRRSKERRRSPSPRKSSHRSSRDRKKRSVSRSRDSKNNRTRDKSRRSRSRDKKKSRSPGRKRDRSRDRRRRSRSRDRKRSRSRDRRGRRRSTSKDRDRHSRREDRHKDKDKEGKDVKVKRDYDAEEKDMAADPSAKIENGQSDSKSEHASNGKENGISDPQMAVDEPVDSNSEDDMNESNVAKGDPMANLEEEVMSKGEEGNQDLADDKNMDTVESD